LSQSSSGRQDRGDVERAGGESASEKAGREAISEEEAVSEAEGAGQEEDWLKAQG